METKVDELLDKISEHVKEMVKTETVIGEEFTIGEYTCKPVIRVGMGFGSGAGTGDDEKSKSKGSGGGAGAGIGISPVGFLVTKGEEISFIPTGSKSGLSAMLEKIPDVIEKVAEMKTDKQGDKNKKEEKKEEKKKD